MKRPISSQQLVSIGTLLVLIFLKAFTFGLVDEFQCSCPDHPGNIHRVGGSSKTTTNDSKAKIFYLVLIHNERTARDAIHLIRSVRYPGNTILIHVDSKVAHLSHDSTLQREMEHCDCGATIRVESVHSVEWSKWSMNLPTLWGMELARTQGYDWDVFINLSGDTLAVYDAPTTAELLAQLPYNFVTSKSCETGLFPTSVYEFPKIWHKRRHYTKDETEEDPTFPTDTGNVTITTHFGSQWVILQRDFVEWLCEELGKSSSWVSQFRDFLQTSGKLMTDETFVPTILMHAPERFKLPDVDETGSLIFENGTVSSISHARYERMDEHFPSAGGHFPDQQRYEVPESLLSIIDQPRVWGPYFLGVYDLGGIRATGALFARKVSAVIDDNMLRVLPVQHRNDIPDIHWPENEISLTGKPDWTKEKELFRQIVASKSESDDEEL